MTLEERVTKLEANEREQYALDKSQDEQIKTLFETVKVMRNIMYTFCLLMLLALIYGALGPRGFNAVTKSAPCRPDAGDKVSFAIPAQNDLDRWQNRRMVL